MADCLPLGVHRCHQTTASLWEHKQTMGLGEGQCLSLSMHHAMSCTPYLLYLLEHQESKAVNLSCPVFFMKWF